MPYLSTYWNPCLVVAIVVEWRVLHLFVLPYSGDHHLHSALICPPSGTCIYYHEWNRTLNTLSDDIGEERRLMFGMLYSVQVWEKPSSYCREPICPPIFS